jgi:hypothetical protein
MSRALNVNATVAEVIAMAAKCGAMISAIEPLLPEGTRVVFMNRDAATVVEQAFGRRVLKGAIVREPWTQRRIN